MGLFEHFPYTNFHGLNLDWLVGKYKELDGDVQALKDYIATFVDDQLVPIIEAKLDEMLEDGDFDRIIARLEVIDYVTPEMFGAAGDGVTDDTAAFQAAVDSGYNVCLLMSSSYLITDSIRLKGTDLADYEGTRMARTIFSKADTNYNNPDSSICCSFADATRPIFSIESHSWTFNNITINGRNKANGNTVELTAFLVNMNGAADVDVNLISCNVSNVAKVFDFTGRGLLIRDCRFTHAYQLADIKWAGDSGGSYHDNVTGQRAITIQNNRFHSCAKGPFIKTAPSANAFGLEYSGNNFDRGHCVFMECNGPVRNWLITNNHFIGMKGFSTSPSTQTNGTIHILNDVNGMIISNNAFYQVPSVQEGIFNHLLVIDEDLTVKGLVIENNWLNMAISGCWVLNQGSTMNSCIIAGNSIEELIEHEDVTPQPRAILKSRGSDGYSCCVISNNTIGSVDAGVDSLYAFYHVGNVSMNYCKVIGNVIPGSTDMIDGTGTLTDTGCLFDDNLITP